MLAFLAKGTFGPSNRAFAIVLAFFALYFAYVATASYAGLFDQVFLPPLVLLYCTFPLATFLFTVVIHLKAYRRFLLNVRLESLVGVHLFRLIGVFFLILAFHEALPKFFAIIAGLGDMITAITSVWVTQAIRQQKSYARALTLSWNIFGSLDIIFTAVTAILLTKLSIDNGTMGVDTLARFPFCFIPAFAPPTILFLHFSVFKKLNLPRPAKTTH
ncbi:MAG: hypothetical protein MUC97_04945 [Bernardetiaceae bacterium]|nr:hypothetical protein [Bernardetiaceae bacterium]